VNGEPSIALVFTPQTKIFPPTKVWKRLKHGDEDNICSFYAFCSQMLKENGKG
jgi:hypothetical protein